MYFIFVLQCASCFVCLTSSEEIRQWITSSLQRDPSCGHTIGCYHDCTDEECSFLVTWQDRPDKRGVKFCISKYLNGSTTPQWVALGFSHDRKMGEDSVVECVMTGYHDIAVAHLSFNVHNFNIKLKHSQQGLREVYGRVEDGVLTCSFVRAYQVLDHQQIYDLLQDWYLLVASGPMSGDHHSKLRHSLKPMPYVSPHRVDLQSTEEVFGTAKFIWVKVHGCLMIFSWIFLASISIVVARYYKTVWPKGRLCSHEAWFQIHWLLMVISFLSVCAAIAVIFLDVQGWSKISEGTSIQQAHPIIGVVITAFMFVNPALGLLRPKRGTQFRPVFNLCHCVIGRSAHILAVLNIIIGVTFLKASTPFYVVWILVAFSAYHFLFEVLLEVYECFLIKSGSINFQQRDEYATDSTDHTKAPPGSVFKKTMLALHVIVTTGIAGSCLLLVALC